MVFALFHFEACMQPEACQSKCAFRFETQDE